MHTDFNPTYEPDAPRYHNKKWNLYSSFEYTYFCVLFILFVIYLTTLSQ
jgi:hypothetical protein